MKVIQFTSQLERYIGNAFIWVVVLALLITCVTPVWCVEATVTWNTSDGGSLTISSDILNSPQQFIDSTNNLAVIGSNVSKVTISSSIFKSASAQPPLGLIINVSAMIHNAIRYSQASNESANVSVSISSSSFHSPWQIWLLIDGDETDHIGAVVTTDPLPLSIQIDVRQSITSGVPLLMRDFNFSKYDGLIAGRLHTVLDQVAVNISHNQFQLANDGDINAPLIPARPLMYEMALSPALNSTNSNVSFLVALETFIIPPSSLTQKPDNFFEFQDNILKCEGSDKRSCSAFVIAGHVILNDPRVSNFSPSVSFCPSAYIQTGGDREESADFQQMSVTTANRRHFKNYFTIAGNTFNVSMRNESEWKYVNVDGIYLDGVNVTARSPFTVFAIVQNTFIADSFGAQRYFFPTGRGLHWRSPLVLLEDCSLMVISNNTFTVSGANSTGMEFDGVASTSVLPLSTFILRNDSLFLISGNEMHLHANKYRKESWNEAYGISFPGISFWINDHSYLLLEGNELDVIREPETNWKSSETSWGIGVNFGPCAEATIPGSSLKVYSNISVVNHSQFVIASNNVYINSNFAATGIGTNGMPIILMHHSKLHFTNNSVMLEGVKDECYNFNLNIKGLYVANSSQILISNNDAVISFVGNFKSGKTQNGIFFYFGTLTDYFNKTDSIAFGTWPALLHSGVQGIAYGVVEVNSSIEVISNRININGSKSRGIRFDAIDSPKLFFRHHSLLKLAENTVDGIAHYRFIYGILMSEFFRYVSFSSHSWTHILKNRIYLETAYSLSTSYLHCISLTWPEEWNENTGFYAAGNILISNASNRPEQDMVRGYGVYYEFGAVLLRDGALVQFRNNTVQLHVAYSVDVFYFASSVSIENHSALVFENNIFDMNQSHWKGGTKGRGFLFNMATLVSEGSQLRIDNNQWILNSVKWRFYAIDFGSAWTRLYSNSTLSVSDNNVSSKAYGDSYNELYFMLTGEMEIINQSQYIFSRNNFSTVVASNLYFYTLRQTKLDHYSYVVISKNYVDGHFLSSECCLVYHKAGDNWIWNNSAILIEGNSGRCHTNDGDYSYVLQAGLIVARYENNATYLVRDNHFVVNGVYGFDTKFDPRIKNHSSIRFEGNVLISTAVSRDSAYHLFIDMIQDHGRGISMLDGYSELVIENNYVYHDGGHSTSSYYGYDVELTEVDLTDHSRLILRNNTAICKFGGSAYTLLVMVEESQMTNYSDVLLENNVNSLEGDNGTTNFYGFELDLVNLQISDHSGVACINNSAVCSWCGSSYNYYFYISGVPFSQNSYFLDEGTHVYATTAPYDLHKKKKNFDIWLYYLATYPSSTSALQITDNSWFKISNVTGAAINQNGSAVGFSWDEELNINNHSIVEMENINLFVECSFPEKYSTSGSSGGPRIDSRRLDTEAVVGAGGPSEICIGFQTHQKGEFTLRNGSQLIIQNNTFIVNASDYVFDDGQPRWHTAVGMSWGSFSEWYGALVSIQGQSIFSIARNKIACYCGANSPCVGLLAPVINTSSTEEDGRPSWVHIQSNEIKVVNSKLAATPNFQFYNASPWEGNLTSCIAFPPIYNSTSVSKMKTIRKPSDKFSNFYPNGILTISENVCDWKYTLKGQEDERNIPAWNAAFNGTVLPFTNVSMNPAMSPAILANASYIDDPKPYKAAMNGYFDNLVLRCNTVQEVQMRYYSIAPAFFLSSLSALTLKSLFVPNCQQCSVQIDCSNTSILFLQAQGASTSQCYCRLGTLTREPTRSATLSASVSTTESLTASATGSTTRTEIEPETMTHTVSENSTFSEKSSETITLAATLTHPPTLSTPPSESLSISWETLSVTDTVESSSMSSSHSRSATKTQSDATWSFSPTLSTIITTTQTASGPTPSVSPTVSGSASVGPTQIAVQPTSFGSLSGANLDFRVQGNHFRVLDINGSVVSNPLRQQQIMNSLLANVTSNQSFLFLPKDCFNVTVRPQNREIYRELPEILANSAVSIRMEVADLASAWTRNSYFWDYIIRFHVIPLPRIIQPEFLVFTFNAFCFNTQTLLQIVEQAIGPGNTDTIRIPQLSDSIEIVVQVAVQQRNLPEVSKEAEKDADTSVTGSSVASLFAGASAADAVEAERILGLIEALKCDYVFGEKLPFRSHPFGNPIGDNERLRYFFGAAIMNPVLIFLMLLGYLVLCQVYRKAPFLKKKPQYDYLTFLGFCGAVEWPSRSLVCAFFLMQDSVQSALIVAIHADMTENKIMKGVSVLIVVGWVGFALLIVLLNTVFFHAVYNPYERMAIVEERLQQAVVRQKGITDVSKIAEGVDEDQDQLLERLLGDQEDKGDGRPVDEVTKVALELKEARRKLRWVFRMDGQGNWNDNESHRIDEQPQGDEKPKGVAILHTLPSRMHICTHRTYRPGRHWFFAIELLFVFYFALLGAIRPKKNCDGILFGTVAGFGIYCILMVFLHPIVAHCKQWKSGLSGFFQFASSSLMLVGKLSGSQSIIAAGSYVAMGAMYMLSTATVIFIIWKVHRFRKMLKLRKKKYIESVQKDNAMWAEKQKRLLAQEDQSDDEELEMAEVCKADIDFLTYHQDQPEAKIYLGPFDTTKKLYALEGQDEETVHDRLQTFYEVYNPSEAAAKVSTAMKMDATEDEVMCKLFAKYNVPVEELKDAAAKREEMSRSDARTVNVALGGKSTATARKARKPPERKLAAPPVLRRDRNRRPTGGPGGRKFPLQLDDLEPDELSLGSEQDPDQLDLSCSSNESDYDLVSVDLDVRSDFSDEYYF